MRLTWTFASVVMMTVFASAAVGSQAQQRSPEVEELLAADQGWVTAFTKCDLPAMDRLVGSDLTFVNLTGGLIDKPAFMKIVGSCAMEEGTREFVTGRLLDRNIGNVIGRFRYRMKNQAAPAWQMYNRTYVKRDGTWQLVSASHTAAKPPEAAK